MVNYGPADGGGGCCLSGRITQTHGKVFLTQNTLGEVDYNTRFRFNRAETEITGRGYRGGGRKHALKLLAITMMRFTVPKYYSCVD